MSQVFDNSTFDLKVALRQKALLELGAIRPVVMETHAGAGKIHSRCYSFVRQGVAFDTDGEKVQQLAAQRPTWAVYQSDSRDALAVGAGDHLEVNFVDVDPWGQPWPTIDAFWESTRPRPDKIVMAVNDGLRRGLRTESWEFESVRDAVEVHGRRLWWVYLDVCKEMMTAKAAAAGYTLTRWRGYYTGTHNDMTHYAAVFEKRP